MVCVNIYDSRHLRSSLQVKDLGNNSVLLNDSRKLLGIVMVQFLLSQMLDNLPRNNNEKNIKFILLSLLNSPIAIGQISAMGKALQQRM